MPSALCPLPSALVDDRTAAYMLESQPVFEDLRQVAAQLAGLLVLAATGSRDASPDHPMLGTAERLFTETFERFGRAQASERARLHHESLRQAAESLRHALTGARAILASPHGANFDAALVPLRDSYNHLQQATRALPGFRMVAFEQGCCAGGRAVSSSGSLATS